LRSFRAFRHVASAYQGELAETDATILNGNHNDPVRSRWVADTNFRLWTCSPAYPLGKWKPDAYATCFTMGCQTPEFDLTITPIYRLCWTQYGLERWARPGTVVRPLIRALRGRQSVTQPISQTLFWPWSPFGCCGTPRGSLDQTQGGLATRTAPHYIKHTFHLGARALWGRFPGQKLPCLSAVGEPRRSATK
jgi:hypothetical protein